MLRIHTPDIEYVYPDAEEMSSAASGVNTTRSCNAWKRDTADEILELLS